MENTLKLAIIGTRGIPANYGGFETFAEELSINIKQMDSSIDVTVIADSEQRSINDGIHIYNNVNIIYSKYNKSLNPLIFYLDSTLQALKYDVILACGVGGGYFSFLPKFSSAKIIFNPDGIEWKRAKWSPLKRFLLKTMEWCAVKFSDFLVCDSEGVTTYIKERYQYQNKIFTIEYGAYVNEFMHVTNVQTKGVLNYYGLVPNSYHLVVSRLEPENHVSMIIDGYNKSEADSPLVIVGKLDTAYFLKTLKGHATDRVVFLGGIYNKDELSIVRANALTYLHGHSVGGTNPSLLEAMGSGNLCLCHDNIFNRKTVGKNGLYFKNEEELKQTFNFISDQINIPKIIKMKENVTKDILEYFTWHNVTKKYIDAFYEIVGNNEVRP